MKHATIKAAFRMREDGLSWPAIARELGVHENQLHSECYRIENQGAIKREKDKA